MSTLSIARQAPSILIYLDESNMPILFANQIDSIAKSYETSARLNASKTEQMTMPTVGREFEDRHADFELMRFSKSARASGGIG